MSTRGHQSLFFVEAGGVTPPDPPTAGIRWQPLAGCVMSNDDQTVTSTGNKIVIANVAFTGKQYVEFKFAPNADAAGVGVSLAAFSANYLGQFNTGFGHYTPSNDLYYWASLQYNGATNSTTPSRIGMAFDATTGNVWIRLDGGSGWEGGGDPVAGTFPTFAMGGSPQYPACCPNTTGGVTIYGDDADFTLWTPSGDWTAIGGPAVAPELTFPNFKYMSNGFHFDGADGSTTFNEVTGSSWSVATGTVEIDTADSEHGGASALFNGAIIDNGNRGLMNGYITGDFCWCGYISISTQAGTQYFIDHGANGGVLCYTSNQIAYYTTTTGIGVLYSTGFSMVIGHRYFIEVSRISGVTYIFADGALVASGSDAHNYGIQSLRLGGYGGGGSNMANGHMDEMAFYNGVGWHSSAYTPPSNTWEEDWESLPWTFSQIAHSPEMGLSSGDTVATCSSGGIHRSARCYRMRDSGKRYFEMTTGITGSDIAIGIASADINLQSYVGNGAREFSYYQASGVKLNGGTPAAYGSAYTGSHVIGVAVDFTSGKIWFSLDGVWQNSGDPAAGTGEAYSTVTGRVFPAASAYASGAAILAKLDASSFTYSPPSGFSAWCD